MPAAEGLDAGQGSGPGAGILEGTAAATAGQGSGPLAGTEVDPPAGHVGIDGGAPLPFAVSGPGCVGVPPCAQGVEGAWGLCFRHPLP
mmetsp:Transcript_19839/g.43371  ORF Transcript_19839/g.43371 Transcript_19839/m.43371 type:complete len:88 (-) Transcript_19839:1264-1527(-)